MDIYNRQEEIRLITKQSIAIIGCGGIGFWVGKFAAMSGIPKIYLFDNDIIEDTNLNRLDVPARFIGKNKADVLALVIRTVRPDCDVKAFPYKFASHLWPGEVDWLIDCTDNGESQIENQRLANNHGTRYMKAGYDGENLSIHNEVASWGEAPDGYQIIPSWVVPASIVAALTVAKIMKYPDGEPVTNIGNLMNLRR